MAAQTRIVQCRNRCFDVGMARVLSPLFALLAVSGCASNLVLDQEGALAVFPHVLSDSGHIVVETTLNDDGPFRFIIDTGASISAVFDRALARTTIGPAGEESVRVLGMAGSGDFPVIRIARLSVGSETWEDARLALLPDVKPFAAQVDGILGVDFLSRYAVWYSQHDQTMRLYPRELVAQRSYNHWNSIPLFELGVGDGDITMFAFDMFIDAQRIPTILDLGASVNLMNMRAAKLLDVPVRRVREAPVVWGVTGKTAAITELHVWFLQVRNMRWRNRTFLIGNFPVFEVLGVGNKPMAIAGTSLFKQRDFIIDFARRRLLVASRG